jgi:CheY-like chemotaxis protein
MADKLNASREDLERQIEAATRELMLKKEEAERGNHAKTRFLAAASHDLRQPMHALGLFVAELGQNSTPPTPAGWWSASPSRPRRWRTSSTACSTSRASTWVCSTARSSPFRCSRCSNASTWTTAAKRSCAASACACAPPACGSRATPAARTHPPQPHQQRPALRPGGTVLLACRKRGGKVRIEVRDNGPGIAPEAQEAIFQEFVQLDNPERNRAKGLGLGLAIVRRLTDLLSHPLELRPPRPRCALRPRAARGAGRRAPRRHPAVAPPLLRGLHVLLADDDELALASTTGLLESWGCRVTAIDTPEARCPLDRQDVPDMIVCDYQVAGTLDGLAVIHKLHEHFGRPVPAIILSSDTSQRPAAMPSGPGFPCSTSPCGQPGCALLQRKTQA